MAAVRDHLTRIFLCLTLIFTAVSCQSTTEWYPCKIDSPDPSVTAEPAVSTTHHKYQWFNNFGRHRVPHLISYFFKHHHELFTPNLTATAMPTETLAPRDFVPTPVLTAMETATKTLVPRRTHSMPLPEVPYFLTALPNGTVSNWNLVHKWSRYHFGGPVTPVTPTPSLVFEEGYDGPARYYSRPHFIAKRSEALITVDGPVPTTLLTTTRPLPMLPALRDHRYPFSFSDASLTTMLRHALPTLP